MLEFVAWGKLGSLDKEMISYCERYVLWLSLFPPGTIVSAQLFLFQAAYETGQDAVSSSGQETGRMQQKFNHRAWMALPCCSGFDRPQTEKMENENVLVKIVGKKTC